ncbi:sulfatase-like hydrolase/transferase [Desulfuribacillus alkaliarsenatis]|uniref:Sulfatase N-terminal domain-containing protein n=1 Tax=Desulfuribacillus alkaliarsenatis TaxID=766136 RepID=A0A1E5G3R4_9FIRM|nr:sulfatase-like hydrolase/transferase [Desulfuribacillus alkaliarsenatis]OEF97717.1 hypothetical protein BHF68_14055 [Desulfuribacillus alkaliarsenatis]
MSKFQSKLDDLLIKYDLIPIDSDETMVEKIMKEIWAEIPTSIRTVIWGAGAHTNELVNLLPINEKNIVGILDIDSTSQNQTLHGYPVYDPSYIKDGNIEMVVISSFVHRQEMKDTIGTLNPKCKHIDFYDELAARGIELQCAFFASFGDYQELYRIKSFYESAKVDEEREHYLFQLICRYLSIKDFVYAKQFSTIYIENNYKNSTSIKEFWDEFAILTKKIHAAISKRNTLDISMFVIDALRYKDITAMPYLNSLAENSAHFTKAFATNLHTRMSLLSILTGKLPIDDELYKQHIIILEESPLLSKLKNSGYRLRNYTLDKNFIADGPDMELIRLRTNPNETATDSNRVIRKSTPSVLWDHICCLAENIDSPIFTLLHLIAETHRPHLCGFHKRQPLIHQEVREVIEYLDVYVEENLQQTPEEFIEQYRECVEYVDTQLSYYSQFFPGESLNVFFGDHGQAIETVFQKSDNMFPLLSCHDDRIHVPLILNGRTIKSKEVNQLFSLKDLGQVLIDLLNKYENYLNVDKNTEKLEVSIPEVEFVPIQFEPIYNKDAMKNYLKAGGEKFVCGTKAVRTENEKYVLYANGEEEFYILPDEVTNISKDYMLNALIKKTKNLLLSKEFPRFN